MSGCNSDVDRLQISGEKIVISIEKLAEGKGALSREEVVVGGVDLGEWKYVQIDDAHFMLSHVIGPKKHLSYRSDLPGKFGKGWRTIDDSGNEKWLR